MKKISLALALVLGSTAPILAGDVTGPVREIMDATIKNWSGADSDWIDIFDATKLSRLYSKDFVTKYQAAIQNPAADEDGVSPFDYDVIVNGEDACPLEDLTYAPQPATGGTTEVVVTFKKATCMDDGSDKQAVTTVRFEMRDEAGRPVIDDIVTEGDPGQPANSLKETMVKIANGQ
ncbi:hypothetical protein QO004_000236 [Rhizobium mesoamericanum]|uniref:hypothetical protein n=1 Tax=Rhizobium mesoamericanum TaxID=1079800 RepID=UPI00278741D7|nr:hypothetical protein [Rhizobium mesoamericanum]MDQ0558463.1 hypothetical protein [Rhizobium mesoamericanum]